MQMVIGMLARPAARALQPPTVCSWRMTKNSTAPSAA